MRSRASESARRIAGNVLSIFASDAINKIATFAIYAMISRFLGTHEFGQISLALTLFYTFQVLANAGLKTLFMRDIAYDKTQTASYYTNGIRIVLVTASLSILLLFAVVNTMNYAEDTVIVILLMALGLIPMSLTIVYESIFQAWEKMRFIAYANAFGNLFKVIFGFTFMLMGADIITVVSIVVIAHVSVMLIEWFYLHRHIIQISSVFDFHFALNMLKKASTFFGIEGITAIGSGLNVILLSTLMNESEVGRYSAISQLMVSVTLVIQSIATSIFPIACRKFDSTFHGLKKISEYLFELLFIIALPSAIGMFMLAEPILLTIYGNADFIVATQAMGIMVWAFPIIGLTKVFGQVLLASHHEKITLRIVLINTIINLILGYILIQFFGIIGAAVTFLVVHFVNMTQHGIPALKLIKNLETTNPIWNTCLASFAMACYIALLPAQNLWITIASASLLYFSLLLLLTVWTLRGFKKFKARYLYFEE